MQLTMYAIRRAPHGAWRLLHSMSHVVGENPTRSHSGIAEMRWPMVIGRHGHARNEYFPLPCGLAFFRPFAMTGDRSSHRRRERAPQARSNNSSSSSSSSSRPRCLSPPGRSKDPHRLKPQPRDRGHPQAPLLLPHPLLLHDRRPYLNRLRRPQQ